MKGVNMKHKEINCDCDVIHGEIVSQVSKGMPCEEEFQDIADFFKVMGDSTRVKLMWALDRQEMCVCDLAVLLGMTKSAISHQLRALREAKLVKFRKEGKVVFYSLADEHVQQIFEKGQEHVREGCRGEDV